MKLQKYNIAEMRNMRIWRVGIIRNIMLIYNFVVSMDGKVNSKKWAVTEDLLPKI